MNIIEAVLSGLPFRRDYWTNAMWLTADPELKFMFGGSQIALVKEDFMAQDWETRSPLKIRPPEDPDCFVSSFILRP